LGKERKQNRKGMKREIIKKLNDVEREQDKMNLAKEKIVKAEKRSKQNNYNNPSTIYCEK
jgi:hypothetical protein